MIRVVSMVLMASTFILNNLRPRQAPNSQLGANQVWNKKVSKSSGMVCRWLVAFWIQKS